MEKTIKTPDGTIIHLAQTTRLGHGIDDSNDPKAKELIWVFHNFEGPAIIKSDGTKEYYFWGIFQGNDMEAIKEFKRTHTGIPPAKNPLFKNR
jgi:hypothetical protein